VAAGSIPGAICLARAASCSSRQVSPID
jgi:hypothetical protein